MDGLAFIQLELARSQAEEDKQEVISEEPTKQTKPDADIGASWNEAGWNEIFESIKTGEKEETEEESDR